MAALALGLYSASLTAQQVPRSGEALQSCAEIEVEADRLACYDRLARRALAAATPAAPAAPGAATPANEARAATPASEPSTERPAAPANEAASERSAAPSRQSAAAARNRSEEAAAAGEAASDKRPIRVVALRKNLSGLALFTTETGEIWRQLAVTNRRFPTPPFEAELEPAANGSFFLVLGNGAPRVRVARVD